MLFSSISSLYDLLFISQSKILLINFESLPPYSPTNFSPLIYRKLIELFNTSFYSISSKHHGYSNTSLMEESMHRVEFKNFLIQYIQLYSHYYYNSMEDFYKCNILGLDCLILAINLNCENALNCSQHTNLGEIVKYCKVNDKLYEKKGILNFEKQERSILFILYGNLDQNIYTNIETTIYGILKDECYEEDQYFISYLIEKGSDNNTSSIGDGDDSQLKDNLYEGMEWLFTKQANHKC